MLLGCRNNKTVRVTICCGDATADLEGEFCGKGFSVIQRVGTTFEDFLASEAAKVGDDSAAPRPDIRGVALNPIVAKVFVAFHGGTTVGYGHQCNNSKL